MTAFATIEEAVAVIRDGGMVVVTDDEDRENEGDLVLAADAATPE
jgi:3,4-dihydroxy-2-butanone 4-phosphate synthase